MFIFTIIFANGSKFCKPFCLLVKLWPKVFQRRHWSKMLIFTFIFTNGSKFKSLQYNVGNHFVCWSGFDGREKVLQQRRWRHGGRRDGPMPIRPQRHCRRHEGRVASASVLRSQSRVHHPPLVQVGLLVLEKPVLFGGSGSGEVLLK